MCFNPGRYVLLCTAQSYWPLIDSTCLKNGMRKCAAKGVELPTGRPPSEVGPIEAALRASVKKRFFIPRLAWSLTQLKRLTSSTICIVGRLGLELGTAEATRTKETFIVRCSSLSAQMRYEKICFSSHFFHCHEKKTQCFWMIKWDTFLFPTQGNDTIIVPSCYLFILY